MAHAAPRSGDNEQVPPMDIDGNEIVPGERSSSSLGNACDVGHSAGTKRAREDDIEDLDEPLAQQSLVEIDGPKREREQAESVEESAKRTRLNSEQSKPLNALRNCTGRKKNDNICSTYDVVELFSSPQVTDGEFMIEVAIDESRKIFRLRVCRVGQLRISRVC